MNRSPATSTVDRQLAAALGRVTSGVFILSAAHAGVEDAMLASWVQQASFAPPAVTVAVGRDRSILPLVRESGRLAVSILADGSTPLLKKYARGVEPTDAFTGVNVARTPAGLPALADALAFLDARLLREIDFGGDHTLLLAEVTAGRLLHDAQPITHVRRNGMRY